MPFVHLSDDIQYVIGIDFGNGETSAAYCSLDNDAQVQSVDINNLSTIVSAIGFDANDNVILGGNDILSKDSLTNCGVYLKGSPKELNAQPTRKNLYAKFVKEIYSIVKRNIEASGNQLNDYNHLVFVACPSMSEEWDESAKNEYARFMAEECGLPILQHSALGKTEYGVFRESRAAYLWFKQQVQTRNIPNDNILVIDFGSSTVDVTYHAESKTPIDKSYTTIGAQNVEEKILEWAISDANDSISNEERALLREFKADVEGRGWYQLTKLTTRMAKETFYNSTCPSVMEVTIKPRRITGNRNDRRSIEILIDNEVLNNDVLSNYKEDIKTCFEDFKANHLQGRTISAIILTGGATKMDFVSNITRDVFRDGQILRSKNKDNISLAVSNGIAMAGRVEIKMLGIVETVLNELKETTFDTLKIATPRDYITEKVVDKIMDTQEEVLAKVALPGSEYNTYNKIQAYLQSEATKSTTDLTQQVLNEYVEKICEQLSEDGRVDIQTHIENNFPGLEVSYPNWTTLKAKNVLASNKISTDVSMLDLPVGMIMLNVVTSLLGAALIGCLNAGALIANLFVRLHNAVVDKQWDKLEYISLEDAITNIGFEPDDVLSDKRRMKMYKELQNKKDDVRTEIENKIKEEFEKKSIDLNESAIFEYCKELVANYMIVAMGEIRHLLR